MSDSSTKENIEPIKEVNDETYNCFGSFYN